MVIVAAKRGREGNEAVTDERRHRDAPPGDACVSAGLMLDIEQSHALERSTREAAGDFDPPGPWTQQTGERAEPDRGRNSVIVRNEGVRESPLPCRTLFPAGPL